MSDAKTPTWKRTDFGYLRSDGAWFLERGAPMQGGNTNAWLIMRRVDDDSRIDRNDDGRPFDATNGNPLWTLRDDGFLDTAGPDATGDLYAHDFDAGALGEAKYTVAVVEMREAGR